MGARCGGRGALWGPRCGCGWVFGLLQKCRGGRAERPAQSRAQPLRPLAPAPQIGDEEGAAEHRRQINSGRLNQRISQAQGGKTQQQRQAKGGRKGGSGASTARAGGRRV